jgi:hypothetical protein
VTPTARWPLHPQPGPLESLSFWLSRVACLYRLPVSELLTHNLGQPGLAVPADRDYNPRRYCSPRWPSAPAADSPSCA